MPGTHLLDERRSQAVPPPFRGSAPARERANFVGLVPNDLPPPYTYFYVGNDPTAYSFYQNWMTHPPIRVSEYVMWSCGPDRNYAGDGPSYLYDSTNGTVSAGDVMYSSFEHFSPPFVADR